MHTSTLFIHALNTCIGCLCAAILGLTAHSVALKDKVEDEIPRDATSIGMSLLFWPGVGGIVDALLFALVCILWHSKRGHRSDRAYRNTALFVAAFIFVRPFVALVYTFVNQGQAHSGSSHLTVEAWACDANEQDLCKSLRAARYLQIPVLVLSVLFLGLVIWQFIFTDRKQRAATGITLQTEERDAEDLKS
ncbi:unnamed protein product [Periconia digitata]|uniref:Uncharacterized protein n=1 Tax=Periconia digitata TaxID=1303443 RepID=A0A9W4UBP6_9PLEO|nr:unnamed protein product [Periconia digitata]